MNHLILLLTLILTSPIILNGQYNYGLEVENQDAKIDGKLYIDSGNDNIFIGTNSGINNTPGMPDTESGNWNTFLGSFSGVNNTSGWSNTFIGQASGANNTIGKGNSFFGGAAGLMNTEGIENVYVGSSAGRFNKYGYSNTMIGSGAGLENVGVDNVFIGTNAGRLSETGSHNIFIGLNSGFNEVKSNRLYIDNTNTATPLIYGELDNNRIGINWNSATTLPATLSVNGTASKTAAGSWAGNSDARLKKNISYLSPSEMLQKVLQMKGVEYEWNDDKTGFKRPEGPQYGFIAQDIAEVWPENITKDNLGYLMTSYGTYDHVFVEAIKELVKENQQIRDEQSMSHEIILELKSELAEIKEMILLSESKIALK